MKRFLIAMCVLFMMCTVAMGEIYIEKFEWSHTVTSTGVNRINMKATLGGNTAGDTIKWGHVIESTPEVNRSGTRFEIEEGSPPVVTPYFGDDFTSDLFSTETGILEIDNYGTPCEDLWEDTGLQTAEPIIGFFNETEDEWENCYPPTVCDTPDGGWTINTANWMATGFYSEGWDSPSLTYRHIDGYGKIHMDGLKYSIKNATKRWVGYQHRTGQNGGWNWPGDQNYSDEIYHPNPYYLAIMDDIIVRVPNGDQYNDGWYWKAKIRPVIYTRVSDKFGNITRTLVVAGDEQEIIIDGMKPNP